MSDTVLKPLSILVIEDHEHTLHAICAYLRRRGHYVQSAPSFSTGLRQFSKAPIDVLISDIGLPDGDGCQLLSQASLPPEVFTIAISAFAGDNDTSAVRMAGYHECIPKPFGLEKLNSALEAAHVHRAQYLRPFYVY